MRFGRFEPKLRTLLSVFFIAMVAMPTKVNAADDQQVLIEEEEVVCFGDANDDNNKSDSITNSQYNGFATKYDTLKVEKIYKSNGKVKARTVSGNNGIVTVNAGVKLYMPSANWKATGYYNGRVTDYDQSVSFNAIDESKASQKVIKKYIVAKYNAKDNSTSLTLKANKKVPGGVYAIKLSDEKGNNIFFI